MSNSKNEAPDAADGSAPQAPRRRWPVAGAFLSALVLATVLLSVRLRSTEIELEVVASEFSFRLPMDHALTGQSALETLQFAGAEAVELQGGVDGATRSMSMSLRAGSPGCSGTLLLEGIVLPRGAQVWVGRSANSPALQLRLNAPGAVLQATLDGCMLVGGAATRGGPRSLRVQLGRDELDMTLHGNTAGSPLFVPLLPASELSLSRVDQTVRESGSLVRKVSTLTAGSLVLPGVGDNERRLRFAEDLRFEQSLGELRSIETDQPLLKLRFHGDVRGMTTGSLQERRSLMPTLLEWLRSQHGMSLLWGAALYLFGVFTALMRWWRGA